MAPLYCEIALGTLIAALVLILVLVVALWLLDPRSSALLAKTDPDGEHGNHRGPLFAARPGDPHIPQPRPERRRPTPQDR